MWSAAHWRRCCVCAGGRVEGGVTRLCLMLADYITNSGCWTGSSKICCLSWGFEGGLFQSHLWSMPSFLEQELLLYAVIYWKYETCFVFIFRSSHWIFKMFNFLKIMGHFKFGLYWTLWDKHTALGKRCESYSYVTHVCQVDQGWDCDGCLWLFIWHNVESPRKSL